MEPTDGTTGPSRRRVLGLGAATAGAAWITPMIVSTPAASAASQPPPPDDSTISGVVTTCGNALDQGDQFLVTATQNPGGATGSDTTDPTGAYIITGLPAGTYDIVLHPNGPANTGRPDEVFAGAVVLPPNTGGSFSPDYQANGC